MHVTRCFSPLRHASGARDARAAAIAMPATLLLRRRFMLDATPRYTLLPCHAAIAA